MIKKILVIAAVVAALAIAALFFYRYQIITYSAESVIRSALPGYVKISTIRFDFKAGKAFFEGFKLEGPRGFSDRYVVEIAEISCRYKLKGATILDGLEIFEPVLKGMVLRIERLNDGRVNLSEMGSVIEPAPGDAAQKTGEDISGRGASGGGNGSGPKAADFIKLPQDFRIANGKIIFTDRFFVRGYNVIAFDNMEGSLNLKMDDSYSRVFDVASMGEGNINGHRDQSVRWAINFNPNTPRLTMANRFEVSGVDLITFEPYYDKFSPFEFARARVSGLLIFDFNNGNIGSANELHLTDLVFSVKPGYENAAMFETSVRDLAKYFTTSSGEVIFDFKIKGDMASPQFYLGPISKQAVTAMVVDKVSEAIQKMSQKGQETAATGSSGNTDVDKAMKAIDIFKGFLDKKS